MIQSLARGLSILALLNDMGTASVSEIAEALDVNKSTASRLLGTLLAHEMVQLDKQTKKYWLGFRILHLGEGVKRQLNVVAIARPYMSSLSSEIGSGVHLCTYNNGLAYIVDQIKSDQAYNLLASIGMIEPLHASSVGKCLLAFSGDSLLDKTLAGLSFEQFTPKTITGVTPLRQELAAIRSRGYAIDDEEVAPGVRCIAAPIHDYRGNVRYCVGISGPISNITLEKVPHYADNLIVTCSRIGKKLGYIGRSK